MTTKLVLIRHGQSQWNLENRFTGWVDVDLSEAGREEAIKAGKRLHQEGFSFDLAYTSYLKRAIRTLWITLDELDQMWLPIEHDWRLNERHYGGLTGLNKEETARIHGAEQVHIWRRSYATRPPQLDNDSPYYPGNMPAYAHLPENLLPHGESLQDTVARVKACWDNSIIPNLEAGKRIIIAAHGNSLRSLVKILDEISDDKIESVNIPTGVPLIYELDAELKPIKHYYLD